VKRMPGAIRRRAGALLAACLLAPCAHAGTLDEPGLSGDVGIAAAWMQSTAPGGTSRLEPLPYVYAEDGRFFFREDTFGVKLVPLGWGALELAARVSTEAADGAARGLPARRNPRPVGLGTFQETPWGGLFVDAFVDGVSGGTLLEASYAAELDLGPFTFYPQAGVARRSARYENHLAGVAADDATGVRAYVPGASTTPMLGLSGELPVAAHWVVVAQFQRACYDAAVRESPRVRSHGQSTALLALAYRFG